MGGEITTAHLALIGAILAIIVPIFSALAFFVLQRIVGAGDKSGDELNKLKEQVHALELAQVGQYATKPDLDTFRTEVRESFAHLRGDVNQLLRHFAPNAVLVG